MANYGTAVYPQRPGVRDYIHMFSINLRIILTTLS